MPRTLRVAALCCLMAGCWLAGSPGFAQPAARKPNIVVIFADDVGVWNIGAYHRGMMGGRTPNIDRIAGQVKNPQTESCRYGPDGKVQKTTVQEPPQQKRGVRGRVVSKETAEMKDEMESAAALVHRYVTRRPRG